MKPIDFDELIKPKEFINEMDIKIQVISIQVDQYATLKLNDQTEY